MALLLVADEDVMVFGLGLICRFKGCLSVCLSVRGEESPLMRSYDDDDV